MNSNKNIVLIGLMGAGKTSVGKILAQKINYKFIDIDDIIEARQKTKISKIFETKGEAYFRELETLTIKEFSCFNNLVISTGGGAPQNPINMENLKNNGTLFYLYAPANILYTRLLNEIDNRPMLHTQNPQEKLIELLNKREPFYLQSDFKIDTTNLSQQQVVNLIINKLTEKIMKTENSIKLNIEIPNASSTSYPIIIGQKILKEAPQIIKEFTSSAKLLLVSNDTVFPIYGKQLTEELRNFGFDVKTVIIPDGEDYKNLNWFKVIIDKAIDAKLERKDTVVALGGGVIGDMAGYVASSYLRGINLVQVGTTLLAHVDSSIGGKVGINHSKGKNLIGSFYQPKCVIIDVTTLETLDKRNLKNGLAEVLKYAFIEKSCNIKTKTMDFFNFLLKNKEFIYKLDYETMMTMISYCCQLKAAVVEQDEKETGLRAILNLGHTTGHALEVCGDYQLLSHGEAVSIGIIAALRLAKIKNLVSDEVASKSEMLIKEFELPHYIPDSINPIDIIDAMRLDKKVSQGKIRFVLPCKEIGKVDIYDDITEMELKSVLESMY